MVRFTTVFDPAVFWTFYKPPLRKWLKGLLVSRMDHKMLSSSQCNSVVVELNNFYDNNFIMLRSVFEDFNEGTDHLIALSGLRKLRYPILRHWLLW